MKKNYKIWIIPSAIIVVAGAGIYYCIKRYSIPTKIAIPNTNGVLAKTNSSTTITTPTVSSGCMFPLQKGSKNPCVGQLQDILGITIDDNFGSGTLSALQEQMNGKTTVTSEDDLNNVIQTVLSQDNASNNTGVAQQIFDSYANRTSALPYMYTLNATTWKQVIQDDNGNWVSAGYQLPFNKGKMISTSDYQPYAVDESNGNVIIYCTNGANTGYWSANPNDLTLTNSSWIGKPSATTNGVTVSQIAGF